MKLTAADQLAEALHVTWSRPAETLLGVAAAETIAAAVDTRAPRIVARLDRRDGDAAEIAAAVLTALWPIPGSVPPTWWSSPLGETVRHAMDGPDVSLTHTETADLLGISRASIGQMVARGNLTRHPDGGVSRDSVFRRLDLHPVDLDDPAQRLVTGAFRG